MWYALTTPRAWATPSPFLASWDKSIIVAFTSLHLGLEKKTRRGGGGARGTPVTHNTGTSPMPKTVCPAAQRTYESYTSYTAVHEKKIDFIDADHVRMYMYVSIY